MRVWRTLLPSLGSAPRAWEQTRPLPQRGEPAALYCLFIQSRLKQKTVRSTEPRKAAERGAPGHYRLLVTPTSKPHLRLLLRRTTFKLTVYSRFWLCLLIKVNRETVKWDLTAFGKWLPPWTRRLLRGWAPPQPTGLCGFCVRTSAHTHLPLREAGIVSFSSVSQVSGAEKMHDRWVVTDTELEREAVYLGRKYLEIPQASPK